MMEQIQIDEEGSEDSDEEMKNTGCSTKIYDG